MNIHLIFHNILYLFNILLSFFIIILLFFKVNKKIEKTTLILALVGVIIFITSHVLGVSTSDSELSRRILMFNLVDLFLPVFSGHCVIALIGKLKEQKYLIISSYIIATGLFTFFILNPYYFLLTSVPKMYFPNYYVAGPYYYLMLIFFFILIIYNFIVLFRAYKVSDNINKSRIKYFAAALFLGYLFGSINFLLIYNVLIDPLWGFLFIPLFFIPFAYAIINYELMDIKIIAKKTFTYMSISIAVSFVLISINYLNNIIIQTYDKIPSWTSSLVLSFIISIGLIFFWRKIRETDLLKYEFINIITHKFRTPLTAIKWASNNLKESLPKNFQEDLYYIEKSTKSLVDLTNILSGLSSADNNIFQYKFIKLDINHIIDDILAESATKIKIKNIKIIPLPKSENFIWADDQKIKFVLQTLIDNAINYNKNEGEVFFNLSILNKKDLLLEIKDTGIGIDEKEIKYIFTKFYRTESSKKLDTEGMGIGLYISKTIIEKHGGRIWVKSPGLEKGSSFFVQLPIFKD